MMGGLFGGAGGGGAAPPSAPPAPPPHGRPRLEPVVESRPACVVLRYTGSGLQVSRYDSMCVRKQGELDELLLNLQQHFIISQLCGSNLNSYCVGRLGLQMQ